MQCLQYLLKNIFLLTFCAVLALPPCVADDFSTFSAGEVTECVVPGPAEHGASLAIVVLITHKAVGVLELGSTHAVQVLGPVLAHSQVPLGGHGADDALWVFYIEDARSSVMPFNSIQMNFCYQITYLLSDPLWNQHAPLQ